ncbi:MAG: LamG-like jellyroll fold domain-containing protein, partial [Lacipirellulaceae bacterium]
MKRTSFFGTAAALLILSATTAQAQVPVPDIAHFRFDSVGATTPNDVVGGGDATWFGPAGDNVLATGLINGGSQTNDENGGNGNEHYRVELPLMDGADGLTISLWFNQNVDSNNNSTYNGLFMVRDLLSSFGGGSENWGIALENNNSPRHIDWRLDGAPGPEDDNIMGNNQDRWDHVVYTWDGTDQGDGMGERALFLNGTELQRIDAPIGTITDSGTWRIGDDACCGSREFTGTMDDLAV